MNRLRSTLLPTSRSSRAARATSERAQSSMGIWALWGGLMGAVMAFVLNLTAPWLALGLAKGIKGFVRVLEAQSRILDGSSQGGL